MIGIVDYDDERSIGSRIRRRRMNGLLELIRVIAAKKKGKAFRVLDVGGTYQYWSSVPTSFLNEFDIEIILLNLTVYPLPQDARRFKSIAGDACNLVGMEDKSFDLVHSNSVIEHVGNWSRMRQMAMEMSRVGHAIYIQTPYFWFPIEPHFLMPFLHWLPLSIRCKVAMSMRMGNWPKAKNFEEAIAAQQSAVLLDKRMMESLFPDAEIRFERLFLLPKSLIATRS